MGFFCIRLHSFNPRVTRSVNQDGAKKDDQDIITFAVLVNQLDRGHGATTCIPVWPNAEYLTPTGTFPVTTGQNISSWWSVGPIEIHPGDSVTIIYSGTNVADSATDVDNEKLADVETKILNTILSAAVGAAGLGLIGSAVTGVLGFISNPIEKLLGFNPTPSCDGLIFLDTLQLSGAELDSLAYNDGPGLINDLPDDARLAFITRTYTDVASHDTAKCGPVAQTDVTVSVTRLPRVNLRFWLLTKHPGHDPKNGLRQWISPGQTGSSVRSILGISA